MTKFKAPLLSLLALSCAVHAGEARPIDVPAGDLTAALEMIAKQSGVELLYHSDELKGIRTKGVKGALSAKEALERLLEGTLLTLSTDGETGAMVVSGKETATKTSQAMTQGATVQLASAELRLSQAHDSSSTAESLRTADARDLELGDIASGKGIPEILVKGKRSLNVDIKRTEDDPQPYVVLDRSQIERSGATTLEQFLQQRLPMNTSVGSVGGAMNMTSQDLPGASGINLRGLGDAQTLILIDGHRMSSPMTGSGNLAQGEISGIPLAAIERIEILPSTASGIYGGSATGGVINIITRKDYSGGEARLTYDNTFDADSAVRKLDVLFGTNFNEGKTNLLLSGSYSEANELLQGDRDFAARGRALISRNNSVYSNRPLGSTPNIRSSDGSLLVLDSGTALGSSFTSVPVGYAGVSTDGGAALAQNAGSYNWALSSGALGLRQSLYSEPSVKSGLLVLRHQFSDTLQAFIDLSSSEARRRSTLGGFAQNFTLAANSPFNPFTTAVSVTAAMPADIPQESLTERERAVVGVVKQLPGSWSTSLDFTFDRTEFSYNGGGNTGYGVVASAGGVDILRDLEAFPVDYQSTIVPVYAASTRTTMKDTNLRVSGPLGDLPGGRPMLSGALAYREESVPDTLKASSPTFHLLIPSRSTAVPSAYLEYRVPLFSQKNARPGLKELDLQFAVRGEKYTSKSGGLVPLFGALPSPLPQPTRETNEFSSVDPTIALRWVPVQDLAVRLSYGTGTLPPSLSQLVPIGS
ncbi:TonB-dependent receptor domain-containing protein, partial [Steroidobacter sp.]|uniref:TonB-dependent receptor domain-containing protein n=1 Tax=Steroidobacter sp. TaxID=1978227 RepID=UPI001A5E349F